MGDAGRFQHPQLTLWERPNFQRKYIPPPQSGTKVVRPGPSRHSQGRICMPSRGRGGAGWSSTRSSRCEKDPGPRQTGPAGSTLVRAVVPKRICIPPPGRGGAGRFQHPQVTLRDESVAPSPTPNMSAPYFPPRTIPVRGGGRTIPVRGGAFPSPYDSRPPQFQRGQFGSPQAGPGYRWLERYSESFDSSGQLPSTQAGYLSSSTSAAPYCDRKYGYLARGTMGTSPLAP